MGGRVEQPVEEHFGERSPEWAVKRRRDKGLENLYIGWG
jgi:hypothetical protein